MPPHFMSLNGHHRYQLLTGLLLSLVISLQCSSHALAQPESNTTATPIQHESIPASLMINHKIYQDLDLLVLPDGHFYVPVKYLGKLLDIPVHQPPGRAQLIFSHPVTGQQILLDADKQQITEGENYYPNLSGKLFFIHDGLFTQNDIYLEHHLAEQFLGVELNLNQASQEASLSIDRPIKLLIRESQTIEANEKQAVEETKPDQIFYPNNKKQSVLETITLDFRSQNQQSSSRQNGILTQATTLTSGNYLTTGIDGHFLNSDYTVSPTIAFNNGALGLSDIHVLWQRKGTHHTVTAGTQTVGLTDLVAPNIPIIGTQIASHNATQLRAQSSGVRTFSGDVASPELPVELWQNNRKIRELSPKKFQDNRYQFNDIALQPQKVNHIKIIQPSPTKNPHDATVLYDIEIPYFTDTLKHGEHAISAFAGRVPYQFQQPGYTQASSDEGWLLPQSNKWVAGGRYLTGITDRLTAGVAIAGDTIIGTPQTSQFGRILSQIQAPNLLGNVSIQRDPNLLSGISAGTHVSYRLQDDLIASWDMGISQQHT